MELPTGIDDTNSVLIITPPTPDKALQWAAVLAATGIPYHQEILDDYRERLFVPIAFQHHALTQLTEFEQECLSWPPPDDDLSPYIDTPAGVTVLIGVVLVLMYYISITPERHTQWLTVGKADAARILNGELWRTVTALTLHADVPHLIGNIIGCIFIGGAVCRYLGDGLGWLVIVGAGAVGNWLNASLHGRDFAAIGASTAVFAAVGLLASLRVLRHVEQHETRSYRHYLPWLGALATFALLGTGSGTGNSDVTGHLLGLLCGLVAGGMGRVLMPLRERPLMQDCSFLLLTLAVVGAWFVALKSS